MLALSVAFATGAATAAPLPRDLPTPPHVFLSPSGEPFRAGPGIPDPFEAWFAAADTNHDGLIDRGETRADAERFFKRLDANHDSVIDGFEITAYETQVAPELIAQAEGRFPAGPAAGKPGPSGGGQGARRGRVHAAAAGRGRVGPGASERQGIARLLNEPEPVSGADYDLDGRVSLAEWMQAADQRFEMLDTAGAGHVSRDALEARMQAPAGRRR